MWVGIEFPGDTNTTLRAVQFRMYGEMLWLLYRRARERYLEASQLLQVVPELARELRQKDAFDHRTLQVAHDLIAAWFRFHGDRRQLRLGETPEKYADRMAEDWRAFFESEITNLTGEDEFTRDILLTTAFANTHRGYAAERRLQTWLSRRYSEMLKAAGKNGID